MGVLTDKFEERIWEWLQDQSIDDLIKNTHQLRVVDGVEETVWLFHDEAGTKVWLPPTWAPVLKWARRDQAIRDLNLISPMVERMFIHEYGDMFSLTYVETQQVKFPAKHLIRHQHIEEHSLQLLGEEFLLFSNSVMVPTWAVQGE